MKYLLFVFLVVSLSSCLQEQIEASKIQSPVPAPDYVLESIPVRWASMTAPLNFVVSTSFDATEKAQIDLMLEKWNHTSSYTFFITPASQVPEKNYAELSSYRDSEMGIYRLNQWFTEIGTDALAVTQFFAYRRNVGSANEYLEIIHADVLINEGHFDFSTTGASNRYDLPSVVLHELGHALGLRHTSSTSSIMYPYLDLGDVNRTPLALDNHNIQDLYPTSTTALEEAISVSRSALSFNPSEEGQLVRGVIEILPQGERVRLLHN